jgi:hypothetical protein
VDSKAPVKGPLPMDDEFTRTNVQQSTQFPTGTTEDFSARPMYLVP